jgi:hypothetical protein
MLALATSASSVGGGISIANIMLISFRVRTREIGPRQALGANRRTVFSTNFWLGRAVGPPAMVSSFEQTTKLSPC